MKRDLKVIGTTEINGVEIPNVLGGFGDGKKSLTDKAIGEIHNVEVREIRQLIKNNISRFKENIDYIDLKQINQNDVFFNLDFTKAQVGNSKNIYLLSERGYAKLIKIMDSDLAWDIHDKLIDEYFAMREIINSDEDLKKELLFKLYQGGTAGVEASKKLVELETKPLLAKIEADKEKVEFAEAIEASDKTINFLTMSKLLKNVGFNMGRNKLFEILRTEGTLIPKQKILMTDEYENWSGKICKGDKHNTPYQIYIDRGYFEVKQSVTEYGKVIFTTVITPKGQQWLIKLFKQIELNRTA